jgi:hypothetical protein
MRKQSRHQSVINLQSDAENSDDHWLKQFENKLQKNSVQPRGSVYDEINSIMNNSKSKHNSVQDAVSDMMARSGLSTYLDNVKSSQNKDAAQPKKVAQNISENERPQDSKLPQVIQDKASIKNTLDNIIKETKGNMPIPAIIARLQSLHARDVPNDENWNDEKLIRLVSQLNLQAKKDNPSNYENFDMLGKDDHSSSAEIDPSNSDAFHALMPAK